MSVNTNLNHMALRVLYLISSILPLQIFIHFEFPHRLNDFKCGIDATSPTPSAEPALNANHKHNSAELYHVGKVA